MSIGVDPTRGGPQPLPHGRGNLSEPRLARAGVAYKCIALSNTTLGVFMAFANASIVLIAMPDIFQGIGINPLAPEETNYFLWLFLGYLVVTAMRATFQNAAMLLSIGVFFSIVIAALAARLPATMMGGLERVGLPAAAAEEVAHLYAVAAVSSWLRGNRYVPGTS